MAISDPLGGLFAMQQATHICVSVVIVASSITNCSVVVHFVIIAGLQVGPPGVTCRPLGRAVPPLRQDGCAHIVHDLFAPEGCHRGDVEGATHARAPRKSRAVCYDRPRATVGHTYTTEIERVREVNRPHWMEILEDAVEEFAGQRQQTTGSLKRVGRHSVAA